MSGTFGAQSLRRKLTLVALVTIVATQLFAASVLTIWDRSNARQGLIDNLQTQARIVVDNTAAALEFGDYQAAVETLRSLGVNEAFEHACLYDQRGQLFAAHVAVGALRRLTTAWQSARRSRHRAAAVWAR
jgi:hypothetical protein